MNGIDGTGGRSDVFAVAQAPVDRADLGAARVFRIPIVGNEGDIGKDHVEREIAPFDQQTRRDPAAAITPARDRGRMHQALPQGAGDEVEIGRSRDDVQVKLTISRDDQFDRALDPCTD